jgi:hypothetical protein
VAAYGTPELMGRRSRKRGAAAPEPAPREERPKPPWHPVPLVELCVLVGLILLVLGLIRVEHESGRVMLVAGMLIASLGGLDTALREHFAGYRSHSTLLAGLPAVAVAGALFFASAPWVALVAVAAATFAAVFLLARTAFRRRSGGLSFR